MENNKIEFDGNLFEKLQYQEKVVTGKKFTDCNFKNCQFNAANFVGCYFTDCTFENCDLSLIKVKGCFFNRVNILGCKAIGVNWFEASNPFSIAFANSNISYSGFLGKAPKKLKIKNCVAKEVDFSECNLTEADFSGTDLESARFTNCNLSQANFKEARNYSIDLLDNKISKARFSLPEAVSLLNFFDIIID